jgi:amino acid adenylation domain-containing protein/thioester reductase-like protein
MFVWQAAAKGTPELPELEMTPLQFSSHAVSKFDLTLSLQESEGRIGGGIEYATALFDAATIERYLSYFNRLLEGMVDDENEAVEALPILGQDECTALLEGWGQKVSDCPSNKSFTELFEAQAIRTPEAVAVVCEERQLTYQELNDRANRLAHSLRLLGVCLEERVGLLLSRDEQFLISMLAVLKAGGAYVPLDPEYPQERIKQIVSRSDARLVLVNKRHRGLLNGDEVMAIDIEDVPQTSHATGNLNIPRNPHSLAYVIYTSGSTGTPKGVMVEERGMVNHLFAKIEDLSLQDSDVIVETASQCFDISVWQFLSLQLVGGKVVIANSETASDPTRLLTLLVGQQVSICEVVPSALDMMVEDQFGKRGGSRLSALRWLLVTGEAVPPALCRRWRREYSHIALLNAYGPTECSDDVTHYPIPQTQDSGALYTPIGQPVSNMHLYVLNEMLSPVPVGVRGEIYIGGVGVGRGYLNQATTTAERFIPDAYSSEPGSRMYKSGDLGSWRKDGNLEFIGRSDGQVKIRGFRIELGEIESRLAHHPGVRAAVVLAREDKPGEKQLVAYYTSNHDTDDGPETEQLRAHLASSLPAYMVPAAYVRLTKLPVTANGKIDLKALPAPEFKPKEWRAPRTPHEQALCSLVGEVLGVAGVGLDDNFFDLGGDSIMSTRLAHRARSLGLRLAPRDVFMYRTLEELAAALEKHQGEDLPASVSDLSAEGRLDPDIKPTSQSAPLSPPENIFLTGASGFLGCFLLAELLERTSATVHCLVRSTTAHQGRTKIKAKLKSFGLWNSSMASRIVAVPGDISKPLIGLSPEQFEVLANSIDAIYHSAATVNFIYSYDVLKPSNVLGTQEVIRMACQGRSKALHYISTVSVFPKLLNPGEVAGASEEALLERWQKLPDGYSQTKWVAERLVQSAGSRGLPVTIYRPPVISGSTRSGMVNENDMLWRLLVACMQLGSVPQIEENVDAAINMMPVDYLSRSIVALSQREEVAGHSINMVHDQSVSLGALFESVASWAKSSGLPMQEGPFDTWLSHLASSDEWKELGSFFATAPRPAAQTAVRIEIRMDIESKRLLDSEGLEQPLMSKELLQKYVAYLAETINKDQLVAGD